MEFLANHEPCSLTVIPSRDVDDLPVCRHTSFDRPFGSRGVGGTESAPTAVGRNMRRGWILSIGCALRVTTTCCIARVATCFCVYERCRTETAGWVIGTPTRITPAVPA